MKLTTRELSLIKQLVENESKLTENDLVYSEAGGLNTTTKLGLVEKIKLCVGILKTLESEEWEI